jgi:hypothetical protein
MSMFQRVGLTSLYSVIQLVQVLPCQNKMAIKRKVNYVVEQKVLHQTGKELGHKGDLNYFLPM